LGSRKKVGEGSRDDKKEGLLVEKRIREMREKNQVGKRGGANESGEKQRYAL